jgi:hypothetical protein
MVLMVVGVGVFGLLAASLATFLIERGLGTAEAQAEGEIREVLVRPDRLEAMLVAQAGSSPSHDGRLGPDQGPPAVERPELRPGT